MPPDPPKTPAEWAQWFLSAPVEDTQEAANWHGDHTTRLDDQLRAVRQGETDREIDS
jgi:hypothetical protein